jgi:hypothetical protein
MVSFQPDFIQVGEPPVDGYVPRREMTVIVKQRQVRGVRVVETLRGFCLQEKVVGDEGHSEQLAVSNQHSARAGPFSP